MELITLEVERNWNGAYHQQTTLRTKEGKVKAVISSSLQQPKRNQREITINCNKFLLDWSGVNRTYAKIKDRI